MDELCGAHDAGNQHSQIHTKFAEAFMANNLRGILTTTENNVNNLHHEKKEKKMTLLNPAGIMWAISLMCAGALRQTI